MKTLPTPAGLDANTIVGNMVNRVPMAVYDSFAFPAGATLPPAMSFFSTPLGYYTPGTFTFRKRGETNMMSCGFLTPPRSLLFNRIAFFVEAVAQDASLADFAGIREYFFRLSIMDKIYWAGTIGSLLIAQPLSAYLLNDKGERNGLPFPVPELPAAKYIPPLVYFNLQITVPDGMTPPTFAAPLNLFATLDGVGDLEHDA